MTAAAQGEKETVLLAMPDPETRVLVGFMLRRLGYRVVEARSGAEAIRLRDEGHEVFDLLLADAVMPRMNGHDLAEALRAGNQGLRVLLLAEPSYARSARRTAAQQELRFLCRPFTIGILAAAVREELDRGRAMSASGRA
jgi:CheY-like chemotaxis protein